MTACTPTLLLLASAKGTAVRLTAELCPGCLVIFETCLVLILLTQLRTVSGKERLFPYEIVPSECRAHGGRASSLKEAQGYSGYFMKKRGKKTPARSD